MHAPPDLIVRGLALDSRKAEEGFLFFALPGEKEDGGEFIAEAKARGAACAVCEHPPETEIPYILVPDAHKALALCAAVWYGTPAGKLTVVGVTGTNGKTTTTYLIKQLLERTKGAKVGLIGTNQNLISDKTIPTDRTTPDALTVQRLLAQMVDAGCTYAVMEVSSHALMQSRVEGIRFRVGVFTNLTQDHLDYHGTMEAYCDAKSRLFDQCDIACVNGDDAWTERLLARFTSERITFGQGMTNDLVGWRARYENDCVRFTACTDFDHEETRIGIPGGFSLYNALAALCAVQALGVPLSDAAKALTECVGVKGRCEVVPLDAPFTVIIDYAHTPDGSKYSLYGLRLCRRARHRALWLRGRPRQDKATPHGPHRRGALGLRCPHERQSPHRRPLHHPARCAPRHFGGQNAVRRHREPARGHRLCSARGESARRRRPLRQGARDLSGDRNDKIPPRREGGRAREVRASTKEGRRRRGEGKRT